MKKKICIITGALILFVALCIGIYSIANSPVRYFKGEVVEIKEADEHLVLTIKENEETQYTVHVRYIKLITYRDTNEKDYAHNIEIGDYVEGNYYNDWLHKRDFAEKIVVSENL